MFTAFYHYKYFLIVLLCLGILKNAYCQQNEIDSLKNVLAQRPQNDTTKVKLLNYLAFDCYSVNVDELKKYAGSALALSVKLKYIKGEATAYKNLGLGSMLVNGDPIALEYLEYSLQLFKQLDDTVNQARVLNNIGYYYTNLKEYSQGIKYIQSALDKINGLGKIHFESILLSNIGYDYIELHDFEKAHEYYNQSLILAKRAAESDAIISCYLNMAYMATMEHKYKYAEILLKNTIPYQASFRERDKVDLNKLNGEIDLGNKRYPEAQKSYVSALELAKKIGSIDQIIELYHNLCILDSLTGNYHGALLMNDKYHILNDSLSTTNRNQLLASYQTRFDLEKRKEENQQLQSSNKIYKATINQQTTKELILVIILGIIITGLFYFKRTNDQINKKNEIINQQNKILENTGQVKDKIFSVISHDLRSPIAQMVNLLNLWDANEISYEEMAELTPAVKGGIINTIELLDNLLMWSKNQLNGFQYNPVQFNLHHLVEENIRGLNTMIEHKKINIENNVAPNIILNADAEMIKVVLRNLISNSIKFTPDRGRIRINNQFKNNLIIISVEDNGIGIKDKDKLKIFAFNSHSTLGTNNEKGTGLGLKISYDFIKMNKGNIWMESKENEGSIFYISFPYDETHNSAIFISETVHSMI